MKIYTFSDLSQELYSKGLPYTKPTIIAHEKAGEIPSPRAHNHWRFYSEEQVKEIVKFFESRQIQK